MRIDLKYVTIRELTSGFKDNADDGVVGYGEKLDIRPPYQRDVANGGSDNITNLQPLYWENNAKKSDNLNWSCPQ